MKCKCGKNLVFQRDARVKSDGSVSHTSYRYHCTFCSLDTGKCMSKEGAQEVLNREKNKKQ